jgi:hypothetical protein
VLFEGDKRRLFVSRGKISGKPIEEKRDEGKYGDEQVKHLCTGAAGSSSPHDPDIRPN